LKSALVPHGMGKQTGFTLVEILIVIAILGILYSVALPAYTEHMQRSRRADIQQELLQYSASLERIYSRNGGYPNAFVTQNTDYYTFTYTATDSQGKEGSAQREVNVEAPQAFITTWDTTNNGVTEDNQIMIDTEGEGYNYSIDWGDGSVDNNVTRDVIHTYQSPGVYTIEITGSFPRLVFADVTTQAGSVSQEIIFNSDNHKLLTIESWGNIRWSSMSSMFADASNLVIEATDSPNLTDVSDMSKMFKGTIDIEYDITEWDVSRVTNMTEMFSSSQFNQDIGEWDVSNVVNMEGMFAGASKFDQDISEWNVSKVTSLNYLFSGATSFNQDIGDWDVSNVTTMIGTFGSNADYDYVEDLGWDNLGVSYVPREGATSFNQDLSDWDVSKVKDMSRMFAGASSFNQNIVNWDVSSVTSMHSMFADAKAFNQELNDWNVENVTTMSFMFMKSGFNRAVNLWNVTNVETMNRMFSEATSFNQDISDWYVSKVYNMEFMFDGIALSTVNYNSILQAWSGLQVQKNVKFSAGNSNYSGAYRFARNTLIDDFEWVITDGGLSN